MELSLVLTALRRRWWLILLFTILGGIVGSIYAPTSEELYESRAVLLVSPPDGASVSAQADPDRFVIGQLDILRSKTLADNVRRQPAKRSTDPAGARSPPLTSLLR